jgi:hypothetical protein
VAPGSHIVSAEAPGSYLATKYPERHVAGTGEGSYIQLSGTSMAAAVATGTLALLFDERPSLTPADAKVALQVTSTLMPDAGLIASGAGSISAFAAVEFLRGSYSAAMASTLRDGDLPALTNNFGSTTGVHAQNVVLSSTTSATPHKIVFGTTKLRGRLVLWGKTVVGNQTFVWGRRLRKRQGLLGSSLVNGQGDDGDTIVWGNSDDGDSIVWGNSDDGDSIVWGNSDGGDSIVWGNSDDGDSIVWGNSDDGDSIVWGNSDDGDSIVWGNSDDGDSIVWGNSVGIAD